MKPRESLLPVFGLLFLSLLIFALLGAPPTLSVAYADNASGETLPADTCADTTCTSVGDNDPEDDSIIDVLIDVIDAVL